jgi:type VI secretion system protein ImpB
LTVLARGLIEEEKMAKTGSVAPKERVNITYKPATGDGQQEVELPHKVLVIGDYTGRADNTPLEDRKPINVDKSNFQSVLAEQNVGVEIAVADKLSGEKGAEMSVNLKFKSLNDFEPEGIVEQVPELRKLLELRAALTALKGPLSSRRGFRKKLEALLGDDAARDKLINELGIKASDSDK